MEAFLFPTQLLYTTQIQKADPQSEWRPPSLLYSCYIQLIQGRQPRCQNGGLSLLYTAAIHNAYKEGILSVRMEVSSFFCTAAIHDSYKEGILSVRMETCLLSIQLLYTTHTRKALCQNGGLSLFYTAAIHNSYKEGTFSVRMEASLSFLYSCCIQLV